jgi:hypothetical protein
VHLGFVVSKNRLHIDLDKVKPILEWPIPHNVIKERNFNGITNSIENLSLDSMGYVH